MTDDEVTDEWRASRLIDRPQLLHHIQVLDSASWLDRLRELSKGILHVGLKHNEDLSIDCCMYVMDNNRIETLIFRLRVGYKLQRSFTKQ